MALDPKVQRLVEILGYEEDTSAWKDLLKELFAKVKYDALHEIHPMRDALVKRLILRAGEGCSYYMNTTTDKVMHSFERTADGGIQAKEPVILAGINMPEFGIRIGKVPVYIGLGAKITASTIFCPLYLAEGSRLLRTNVLPGNDGDGSCYIGRNATVEEAVQMTRTIIGSGVFNPRSGYAAAYYHSDSANKMIVGGSTAVSDGVSMQSHLTGPGKTRYWAPDGKAYHESDSEEARSTPLFIGTGCSIGDGAHLVAPSIISKNTVVKSNDGNRPVIDGLVLPDGTYLPNPRI